ncbi:MAG: mechanosensitive ion channel domain-containing protein [Reichenbachiella sp.]|uniref:mechanosensitive ion channel family protein n=1 Tax=Reichenbachiella sp. TaxID=2184521 RepID=UPI003266466C
MKDFLQFELLHLGEIDIRVFHILVIGGVVLATKLILIILRRFFKRQIQQEKFDEGRGWAFYQIIKYIVIVAAIAVGLELIGIKLTLLLAGSAALLVGFGLGVQQQFNDMVSGLVLLFEGTVSIGDIVELEGLVGRITEVNIRTSQLITREGIIIIVPNSKLVSDMVINWSHNRKSTRFKVGVGIAYGSDVKKASEILEAAAAINPEVAKKPKPFARFIDFGSSSLDLEIIFWSKNMWQIEGIKSEIRYEIYRQFEKQGIVIPFPQRDIHIKSNQSI